MSFLRFIRSSQCARMILCKELYSLYSQGGGDPLSLRGLRARIAKCETSEQSTALSVTTRARPATGSDHGTEPDEQAGGGPGGRWTGSPTHGLAGLWASASTVRPPVAR